MEIGKVAKIEHILNLDYSDQQGRQAIDKTLRKIKPFKKYPMDVQIPLKKLEKLVYMLVNKYEITPQWINLAYDDSIKCLYSVSVKTTYNHVWLGRVYAMSIYELFVKLCIKLWAEIKSKNIPVRQPAEAEKRRQKKLDKLKGE
jgi:hypothetical protein